MLYPLAIGGACVVTSIIGTFFVKLGANNSIMGALYKGFIATGVLSLVALWPVITWSGAASSTADRGRAQLHADAPVLVRPGRPGRNRAHHLDHRILYRHRLPPGGSIAEASVTGHGTNVIQGLAVSLESTALPALVIIVGIIVTYNLAGLSASRWR